MTNLQVSGVGDNDSAVENDSPSPPTQPQQQTLKCDEFWQTVLSLCVWEALWFLLKVILLPVQLYLMIGGPLLVLFIWPLWVVINSMVCMGVSWARDPSTAPCLSTCREWSWRHDQAGELLHDQEEDFHGEVERQGAEIQGKERGKLEEQEEEEEQGISLELELESQQPAPPTPIILTPGVYSISPPLMAAILAVWSVFDLLLTLLSALGSLVFVFITFTDADGSIAEGWVLGYILMLISGVSCVISIVFRVAMVIYCLRFRYRVTARAVFESEARWESGMVTGSTTTTTGDDAPSYSMASTSQAGEDSPQADVNVDAVADSVAVAGFALKKLLSSKANKRRLYLFVWSLLTWLAGMVIGSISLHDVLRAQYYLPNAHSESLHGDRNNARCDPMDPLLCLLPFPSSYYLEPSATTTTGVSVDITDEMLPMLKRGVRYGAEFSRLHDGFSVSSMLVWYLSPQVNSNQFVSYKEITQSLLLNSTTLLIHRQTLELHPHFTEKDYFDYKEDKLSYLVPAKSLYYDTTYIVVIKGLRDSTGVLLPAATLYQAYLQAYRQNLTTPTSAPFQADREAKRYTLYMSDVFPTLEGMGVNLSEVQLLWDFHTASEASLFQNLAPLYNLTTSLVQKRLHEKQELYEKITTTSEKCTGTIYSSKMKKMYYTLNVPWYLTDHSRLLNPTKGEKVYVSDTEKQHIPFAKSAKLLLQIPCSVSQGLLPASALMEVGHGLFWDRSFAEMSHITEQANQHGWIMWSMDWRGLSRHDLPQFLRMLLHDMSETGNSTLSAMTQGMSDKLAGYLILQLILEEEYKDVLQHSAFFSSPASPSPSSTPIIPIELRYSNSSIQVPNFYLGISLGAIMGAAWNAYSSIHHRSVLMAGGSLFTFFLGRSDIFGLLKRFTDLQFYSRKDLRLGVQLMQLHLDSFEASGWAHSGRYQRQLQPGQNTSVYAVPSILLQTGIGDSTVTDIAGRILAANLNASLLTPSVHPKSILPSITAPVMNAEGTTVLFQVLYEEDAAALPTTSESGESTSVHKCIIQRQEIISQFSAYYQTNTVIQPVCEQDSTEPEAACVFKEEISCGVGL